MAQEKRLNLTSVARGIESGIETADAERAKALEHLQLVRNTKAKSLAREHDRLAGKYGDKHPRVLALAARIKLNEGLLSNVSAEIGRAKTEIPQVDETSWVLHGFVRDLNGKPLSQLTVAPYNRPDKTGTWVRELGYACTKEPGYFKLEAANVKEGHEKVFLRVLNREGATLFCDSQGITPRPGALDYREIRISGDVVECVSPEGGKIEDVTRAVIANEDAQKPWVLTGTVTDANGRPAPKLVVAIADKAGKFADRLGKKTTTAKGAFKFTFKSEEFADVIAEKVDLFVNVLDANQKQLFTSQAVHFEPGKTETMTIALPK